MISETRALVELGRERESWRKEIRTHYIMGILKGLQIATSIIYRIAQESKQIQKQLWRSRRSSMV